MQQYKIPQEMNVEDKVIGPFTLKGFGFIFAGVMVTFLFATLFKGFGLDMMTAVIFGAFFGAIPVIVGFIPMNGRPLYIYTLPLFSFLAKPRQRVWGRTDEGNKDIFSTEEERNNGKTTEELLPKEGLSSARRKIKDLSLMVDTGGAYDRNQADRDIADNNLMFKERKETERIDKALGEAQGTDGKEVEDTEPVLSSLASVDPSQEFEYTKPDTSDYKLDEYNEKKVYAKDTADRSEKPSDLESKSKKQEGK